MFSGSCDFRTTLSPGSHICHMTNIPVGAPAVVCATVAQFVRGNNSPTCGLVTLNIIRPGENQASEGAGELMINIIYPVCTVLVVLIHQSQTTTQKVKDLLVNSVLYGPSKLFH